MSERKTLFRNILSSHHSPSREKVAPFLDDLDFVLLGGLLDDHVVDVDGREHHQTEGDDVDACSDEAVEGTGEDRLVMVNFSRVCFPVQVGSVEHFHQDLGDLDLNDESCNVLYLIH